MELDASGRVNLVSFVYPLLHLLRIHAGASAAVVIPKLNCMDSDHARELSRGLRHQRRSDDYRQAQTSEKSQPSDCIDEESVVAQHRCILVGSSSNSLCPAQAR